MNEKQRKILAAILTSLEGNSKLASEGETRSRLLKMAYANPEAREHILPLLLENPPASWGESKKYASLVGKYLKEAYQASEESERKFGLSLATFTTEVLIERRMKEAATSFNVSKHKDSLPAWGMFTKWLTKQHKKIKSKATGEDVLPSSELSRLSKKGLSPQDIIRENLDLDRAYKVFARLLKKNRKFITHGKKQKAEGKRVKKKIEQAGKKGEIKLKGKAKKYEDPRSKADKVMDKAGLD